MSENKRSRRRKSSRHQTTIFREFRIEFAIALLFLLGVFLLVEDLEIKLAIYHAVVSFVKTIAHTTNLILKNIVNAVQVFEGSDIVGTILIFLAWLLFTYRVRQKAIARYSDLTVCPDCGEGLNMIHRNMFQRGISKVFRLKIKRYQCKSCDFEGLRIRPLHSR